MAATTDQRQAMRGFSGILAAILSTGIVHGFAVPVLTINGVNADYTTTHVFVDEVASDSVPLTISFSPNTTNVTAAEIFSNLNRRDRSTLDANGDGFEDGIVEPDGNSIVAGDDSNYYKAYAMASVGGGQYALTLYATNCGAYRVTARYKIAGDTNWYWFSSDGAGWRGNTGGRRDHAVVVSPGKARDLVLYEVNALIVDAQGTQTAQRSTLTDLYNGPGSRPYDPVTNRFNLSYATNLGVNWLWLQPVHPIGIEGSVNSPYSVKNYFEISPLMSKANTRTGGRHEFLGFVAAADGAGINIMMDMPFDHTAHDCELGASGINYFAGSGNPGNWQPTDEIRNREARFYSLTNNYSLRATAATNIAIAPDRGDFGKWSDVYDVFFGDYSCLVALNPQDNNNYLNQADLFDYTTNTGSFDLITQNVWRFYSDVLLYWLDQTGCTNGTPANQTSAGVDGIRADFAEGLPPQAWEYIINKTRTRKWDFVFLAESLGPQNVTFRSSRHFDVVNDSVLYDFRSALTVSDYRNIFDSRRTAYGQCLMLWNNASHDVGGYYADPFRALIRYLVGGTIDGAPMIFYGQELGTRQGFGFSVYQPNAEQVPNFLSLNSLQPICTPSNRTYNLDQLCSVYAAAGRARQTSPALRSSNRYFLDPIGAAQPNIFAVAKYQTPVASPNFADVVFAFINLDPTNSHQAAFSVNLMENGTNLFGIQSNRLYNVRNLAAYLAADTNRSSYWLWNGGGGGVSGSNLLANGVSISLNPVPASASGWTNAPFEAQYLKLYDVTPPAAPVAPTATNSYVIGNSVTFTWPAASDLVGGVSGYYVTVGTTPGGADVFNGVTTNTSLTVTSVYGAHLYAQVSVITAAGVQGPFSPSSVGVALVDPSWVPVATTQNSAWLSWNSVSGKTYQVRATTNLLFPFTPVSGVLTATAPTLTFTNNPTNAAQYFRIQFFP